MTNTAPAGDRPACSLPVDHADTTELVSEEPAHVTRRYQDYTASTLVPSSAHSRGGRGQTGFGHPFDPAWRGILMRTLTPHVQVGRREGSPPDIASLLSAKSIYAPWQHDLPRPAEASVEGPGMDQPPRPTVVELHRDEQLSSRSQGGEPHHQTKTFAELQRVLIKNDLVGTAAHRARMYAEHGEPDALTRLRESK